MTDWLDWPFLEARHRELHGRLVEWCGANFADAEHGKDVDAECRSLVAALGNAGFLKLCVADGDRLPDVRSLALARAMLASCSGLADFAFAMQGLGSGAISLAGSASQKAEWLPKVATGRAIAAYALTEPETGSDAA
ncbi:MAG TPA: acyl-CoA dehydrogenase family protein, partial [Reyranellaceae bacterium]|nr:acyl-CoA dehydrogenase family protein [Reyranellaceae bacterium]